MFAVQSRGPDSNSKSLPLKNFNIVDPLKVNNNPGRSVSKENFYRIHIWGPQAWTDSFATSR
ncbi:hypothetical protein ACHQM5_013456 [Ranunculus cassubicifolius]